MRSNFKSRLAAVTESRTPPLAAITQQRLSDIRAVQNNTAAGKKAIECQYAAARLHHVDTPVAEAAVAESDSQATTHMIAGAKQLGLAELVSHLESCREGVCNATK